jgi:hypothetical protein
LVTNLKNKFNSIKSRLTSNTRREISALIVKGENLANGGSGFAEYIKNGFKINASTLDDAFKHINDITLNGAGKPKFSTNKIIGCNNEVNFKAQTISNGGRIEIINEIPTNVNGVKKIEYKTLKLDNQGNPIVGQYVSNGSTHTKTVFDPSIYPEATMKDLGYNAFKDAMDNNKFDIIDPLTGNVIPRSFEGVANNRVIEGHYKVVNGEKIIWTWWIKN